jgi:6-phosphogluconolactonase (cycloisomerase 2 family)
VKPGDSARPVSGRRGSRERRRRASVDLDLTDGDAFLYVLSSGSGAITGFSVNAGTGALTEIGGVSDLAAGYAGLIGV